uniref:Bardet-Biedl syndrome 7 protein homolog n=1 Tax=Caenorhabditis tropicalis TaxID=1561998 RepID=A0A1I7U3Q4_9PELO
MQNYTRTDYAQVGTTNRGCMRVIPADKEKDFDLIVFKTQPGNSIQSLALGGPASSKKKDKIFVASSNTVRGVNRKGKTFFSMETNMAEPANRMFVRGVDVVLTGRKSYTRYHDTVDTNSYLCTEDIHDVVSLVFEDAWGAREYTSVLACGNSTLQIIEGNSLAYEVRLDSIPFTVSLFMGDGGHTKLMVLYGTKTGRLGLVALPQGGGRTLWEIQTTSTACVTTIMCHNVTGNQFPDIIVGKEDGLIELYTVDETDHAHLFGTFACEESITGISCGHVASKTETDIIVCTFTGWLFSLAKTSRPMIENLPVAANFSVKMQQLRSEVEELQLKVNEEKLRYEEITKRQGAAAGSTFFHSFQVHENFEYSSVHGAYNLTIELVIPIDFVVVQSQLPIRLMEVEKNASVVSEVHQDALNPWPLLASYRCQANVCRLELRVQANEGDGGIINLYVCPKITPKCAQVREENGISSEG